MPHDTAMTGAPAPVAVTSSLVKELEAAVAGKELRRQADIMRRMTDLFMTNSTGFSAEQILVFDDIMGRMATAIERAARASFGHRLAALPQAPPRTLRQLALDEAIEVAGPVLEKSEALKEETLIESAKTSSQEHLLAISRRRVIGEAVTDVLVERGNQTVVVSTAANEGALFSDKGAKKLTERSRNDRELARHVFARSDIPREHMLSLFESATEEVLQELESANPSKAELYRYMVPEAAIRVQTRMREDSEHYRAARAQVENLHRRSQLSETVVRAFAQARRFDELCVALSLICELPIGQIERAIAGSSVDQILVLSKAAGFGWETARAILSVGQHEKDSIGDESEASFVKLTEKTARAAVQYYRLRARAAGL